MESRAAHFCSEIDKLHAKLLISVGVTTDWQRAEKEINQ